MLQSPLRLPVKHRLEPPPISIGRQPERMRDILEPNNLGFRSVQLGLQRFALLSQSLDMCLSAGYQLQLRRNLTSLFLQFATRGV